jgi:hypothetical protein
MNSRNNETQSDTRNKEDEMEREREREREKEKENFLNKGRSKKWRKIRRGWKWEGDKVKKID